MPRVAFLTTSRGTDWELRYFVINATRGTDLAIASARLQLASDQLRGRGRTRYESWCRCLVTTLAVNRFGHRAKDLAAYLDKSSVSVSRWLSEGLQLQAVDPGLRSRLRDLEREIEDRAAPPACSRAGDQG